MKTALMTAVAAIALSLGAATASHAATPADFTCISVEKDSPIAETRTNNRTKKSSDGNCYFFAGRWWCP